jgi:hypothetical protein
VSALVRGLRAFGRFWVDFLVGETPELLFAVLAMLGLTALLSLVVGWGTLCVVLLPLLVVGALTASAARERS